LHGLKIPTGYKAILSQVNGLYAFGLALYGIPPSMVKNPPLLDRSRLQCLDLGEANRSWKRAYRGQERFCFGSRHYSYTENSSYFWDRRGEIIAALKTGEIVGHWSDFKSFLTDELRAAETYEQSRTPEEWWE
jgi:hypothetical protein